MEPTQIHLKLLTKRYGLFVYWLISLLFLFLPFVKTSVGGFSMIDLLVMVFENSDQDWGYSQYLGYLILINIFVQIILVIGKKETDLEKIKVQKRGQSFFISIFLLFDLFICFKTWTILNWGTHAFYIIYLLLMYRMVNGYYQWYYNLKIEEDKKNT